MDHEVWNAIGPRDEKWLAKALEAAVASGDLPPRRKTHMGRDWEYHGLYKSNLIRYLGVSENWVDHLNDDCIKDNDD